jgi:hypothetical protein
MLSAALTRAQETHAVEDLHAFRVAIKELRYRTELRYAVGHRELRPSSNRWQTCRMPLASGTTAKCSTKRLPKRWRARKFY